MNPQPSNHSSRTPHPALLRAANSALPPLAPLPAPHSATKSTKAPQNVPSPAAGAKRTQLPAPSPPTPDPCPLTPPLPPRQLSAARLLLAGHTLSSAATSLGLSRYTLARWQKSPAFRAELLRQLAQFPRHQAPQGATKCPNPPAPTRAGKNEPTESAHPPHDTPSVSSVPSPPDLRHKAPQKLPACPLPHPGRKIEPTAPLP